MLRSSLAFLLFCQAAFGSVNRFPSEAAVASEEDYDSETVMESRAMHIRTVCWKYEDASRPEHLRMKLKEATSDSENPAVVFDFVNPAFQVCVPKQSAVSSELWKKWRDQSELELGGQGRQSSKGMASKSEKKTICRRSKLEKYTFLYLPNLADMIDAHVKMGNGSKLESTILKAKS